MPKSTDKWSLCWLISCHSHLYNRHTLIFPIFSFPDRSQFTNIWKSFEAMVLHSRVSHGHFSIIPWTLAFESWKRKISSKHRGIASSCSMFFFWWCSYVQLMLAKHNSLIPQQSIIKIWLPLLQLWYKVNIQVLF